MCVEGLEEGPGCPSWWCLYPLGSDVFIVYLGGKLLINVLITKKYWNTEKCPSTSSQQSQVSLG